MDTRIGDIIATVECESLKDSSFHICSIGFPFDEGVKRNGGRAGSAKGPEAFRKYMRRICASDSRLALDFRDHLRIAELPLVHGASLEKAHLNLTQQVSCAIQSGCIPFVVGGGNDQSYANAQGLLNLCKSAGRPVLVINLDAHLDVRPLNSAGLVHSGSPFRLMLEDPAFSACDGRFVEFGAQPSQCSLEHVRYLQANPRASIRWLDDLQRDGLVRGFEEILTSAPPNCHVFVSFDLDCIRACDAPVSYIDLSFCILTGELKGVSCSSPNGLTAREALEICQVAGMDERVKLFDLSEYNPLIDEYQTGRMVAMMFHAFACGIGRRLKS